MIKKIFVSIFILICIITIVVIAMFIYSKYFNHYIILSNYDRKYIETSAIDGLSMQITFFGIILTLFTLGGAVLAFIGWKEINKLILDTASDISKKTAENEAKKYYQENFNNIVAQTLLNVLEEKYSVSSNDSEDSATTKDRQKSKDKKL